MICNIYLFSILSVVTGILILIRNPKDMAKNTPLDYFGFGVALVGGLPIWVGLFLVLLLIILVTIGLHNVDI